MIKEETYFYCEEYGSKIPYVQARFDNDYEIFLFCIKSYDTNNGRQIFYELCKFLTDYKDPSGRMIIPYLLMDNGNNKNNLTLDTYFHKIDPIKKECDMKHPFTWKSMHEIMLAMDENTTLLESFLRLLAPQAASAKF